MARAIEKFIVKLMGPFARELARSGSYRYPLFGF